MYAALAWLFCAVPLFCYNVADVSFDENHSSIISTCNENHVFNQEF